MIWLVALLVFGALAYWLCMSPTSQVFGRFPYRHRGENRKIIALTFDDGPNEPYTSQLLDFLDSEHITATFFQVASAVQAQPQVSNRMLKSGHIIGNHSLSHKFSNYFLQPSFAKEIAASQSIFTSVLGVEPALFRPPWLFRTPLLLRSVKAAGLQPVSGLFCHNLEVFHINSQAIAQTAIKRAKPGGILIFHDGYNGKGARRTETVEAVKVTVRALKADGYQFVTVSELLKIAPYKSVIEP